MRWRWRRTVITNSCHKLRLVWHERFWGITNVFIWLIFYSESVSMLATTSITRHNWEAWVAADSWTIFLFTLCVRFVLLTAVQLAYMSWRHISNGKFVNELNRRSKHCGSCVRYVTTRAWHYKWNEVHSIHQTDNWVWQLRQQQQQHQRNRCANERNNCCKPNYAVSSLEITFVDDYKSDDVSVWVWCVCANSSAAEPIMSVDYSNDRRRHTHTHTQH